MLAYCGDCGEVLAHVLANIPDLTTRVAAYVSISGSWRVCITEKGFAEPDVRHVDCCHKSLPSYRKYSLSHHDSPAIVPSLLAVKRNFSTN